MDAPAICFVLKDVFAAYRLGHSGRAVTLLDRLGPSCAAARFLARLQAHGWCPDTEQCLAEFIAGAAADAAGDIGAAADAGWLLALGVITSHTSSCFYLDGVMDKLQALAEKLPAEFAAGVAFTSLFGVKPPLRGSRLAPGIVLARSERAWAIMPRNDPNLAVDNFITDYDADEALIVADAVAAFPDAVPPPALIECYKRLGPRTERTDSHQVARLASVSDRAAVAAIALAMHGFVRCLGVYSALNSGNVSCVDALAIIVAEAGSARNSLPESYTDTYAEILASQLADKIVVPHRIVLEPVII